MDRTPLIDIVSRDPKDYLNCALSLMTLSYYNKDCLDSTIAHNMHNYGLKFLFY